MIHRELFGKSAAGLAMKLTGLGLVLVLHLLLARWLGAEGYGTLTLLRAVTDLLAMLVLLGLSTSTAGFVARYLEAGDWPRLAGLLAWSHRLTALLSLTVALLGYLGYFFLLRDPAAGLGTVVALGFAALPLTALTFLRQAFLRALKLIVAANLPEQLVFPIVCVLMIGTLYWIGHLSLLSAMTALLAARALAFAAGLMLLRRRLPAEIKTARPSYSRREWLWISLPMLLTIVSQNVISYADLIMLGALSGNAEVGLYNVANRIAKLISLPEVALIMILGPLLAREFARADLAGVQRLISASAMALLPVSILLAFLLWGGIDPLLSWFGAEFAASKDAFFIISAGELFNACFGYMALCLLYGGAQQRLFHITFGFAMVNIILNFLLIPRWGSAGAAVATAASLLGIHASCLVFVYRRFGILPWLRVHRNAGIGTAESNAGG